MGREVSDADRTGPGGASTTDVTALTLAEASGAVRTGRLSPVDLTRACLTRIRDLNATLNAFITITDEEALAAAREAEREIGRGQWRGPLHGIPIALKDLLDTAGVPTTGASQLFADRVPSEDAEVVRRLRSAGAVILGKLNLHEFAFGATGTVSAFGGVRNPRALDRVAGGSSSGAGAAVAACLCFGAIGTDTGGSIREPAALCGIVGLKPTYGRVSSRGVIPLSPSLDHVGPMTRTVADAGLMLQVIAGYDAGDPASADVPVPDYTAARDEGVSPVRIGVPRALFFDALDPEVQAAMASALAVLAGLTAGLRDVGPLATGDDYTSVLDPYKYVISAEAYAWHREYVERTPELYQPDTLKRIRAGAKVTPEVYSRARRQLEEVRRAAGQWFDGVDLLVTPTSPIPAPTIAELSDPQVHRAAEGALLRNTRIFNALGLPAVSVPCGETVGGLPVGLQITGPPWSEAVLLRLAHAYERETARRRPGS